MQGGQRAVLVLESFALALPGVDCIGHVFKVVIQSFELVPRIKHLLSGFLMFMLKFVQVLPQGG